MAPRHDALHRSRIHLFKHTYVLRKTTLERYRDWKPSQYDSFKPLPERSQERWYVAPVIETRDASIIKQVNWEVLHADLLKADPHRFHHVMHTFNHWACDWFSIMLVRPRSRCWQVACEAFNTLQDSACLDEDKLSAREWESAVENFSTRDVAGDLGLEGPMKDLVVEHAHLEWAMAHFDYENHDGFFHFRKSGRSNIAKALWALRKEARNGV